MDETIENGVGIGRIADDGVPSLDRKLACYDGRSASISVLKDFQEIMPGLGVERLESPIVKDEELDAAECPGNTSVTTIASGDDEFAEQLWNALIEDGAIITTGLVAQRAGKPTLTDAGRAADDQIIVIVDPVAGDEPLEERTIKAARGPIIDVFNKGLLPELGMAQPRDELLIVSVGHLPVEQKGKPFGMGERRRFRGGLGFAKGFGHAEQA